MTGICGWFSNETPASKDTLARMTARIAAASFDGSSQSMQSTLLAVGAAGSPAGIALDRYGLSVAFVGALDWTDSGWKALAREQGTAASVAAAYSQIGPRFLETIRGSFALAVLRPSTRQVLLAVDRMGIHSLAYSPIPNGIVFASTVDAIVEHPAISADMDPQAIYNYLFAQMVPAPGTIYRNVSKLLPGQYLELSDGRLNAGFYWQMRYQASNDEPLSTLEERFRGLLRSGVGRLSAESRTGTFLSGGTDSSTVTGVLSALRGDQVDAYSIGFEASGYDEMEYARIAARHYRVRHHEYYVTPQDVAEAIPMVARAYDEPFGNASAVAAYYCAKRAREDGIELMLAGDGGDEIFGGNERYAKQKVFEVYRAIPEAMRTTLLEPLIARSPRAPGLAFLRKLHSYVQQARIPLPERLETYNFLLRQDTAEVFTPAFRSAFDPAGPIRLMREVYARTQSTSSVDRMMHLDLKVTLADNDLRKVNRMCHLAGLKVRYPFLEDDMVEFSGQIPARMKVKGLKLRSFFKEALRDFLPREIIAKRKHGFGLPFGIWLSENEPLREVAGDSLQSFRNRGYVESRYIDQLLHRHGNENAAYYGVMVWTIMMLEQWLEGRDASRRRLS